ncbi:MAG: 2-C-methyl-D-erythritol 2,4-cyclodiphosphate synthase [Oscillospiraceae bacterium]|nr:2-C-methyl-D-erythritol 2,4-cyclodiphosphate synthase [Oscillospiraceae bacterium]
MPATALRIGQGYDVHRLVEGRKLILGGVDVPWTMGLLGHSDADVLVHAVIDALMGAAGKGDIGKAFPDDDPAFKDIDSMILLDRTMEVIRAAGYEPVNVDCTVVAQRPKLAPYIPQMKVNIAAHMGIDPDFVNVKATTEEKLGFTGDSSGMAAQAVALIEKVR